MNVAKNIKKVRFKKITDIEEDSITVSISSKQQFQASDIGDASTSFEVLNPDMTICNLAKGKPFGMPKPGDVDSDDEEEMKAHSKDNFWESQVF